MNKKDESAKQELEFFLEKFGTVKFTRYDREIKAGKLSSDWRTLPYRININCEYISPLYKKYEKAVSPGVSPMTDAQRYDFECIVITAAKKRISSDEKYREVERAIEQISADSGDYIPYDFNKDCLFPVRALNTIYEGNIKSIVTEE